MFRRSLGAGPKDEKIQDIHGILTCPGNRRITWEETGVTEKYWIQYIKTTHFTTLMISPSCQNRCHCSVSKWLFIIVITSHASNEWHG